MGLTDVLTARAASRGRSAVVSCGGLGDVTVEALPPRELELLYRGPDGSRNVSYAACRELQRAGDTLFREGKVYAPDGILQYLSDDEAELLARKVFSLSNRPEPGSKKAEDNDDTSLEIPTVSTQESTEVSPTEGQAPNGQPLPAEALSAVPQRDGTAQDFGIFLQAAAPHTAFDEAQLIPAAADSEAPRTAPRETEPLSRETGSEFSDDRQNSAGARTSEIDGPPPRSPLPKPKLEARRGHRSGLQVGGSESDGAAERLLRRPGADLQETISEYREESPSEYPFSLYETESVPAERVARELLFGLRRAKWVRGG